MRNDDYRIYEQTGLKSRVSITDYNKTFTNESHIVLCDYLFVVLILHPKEVMAQEGTQADDVTCQQGDG